MNVACRIVYREAIVGIKVGRYVRVFSRRGDAAGSFDDAAKRTRFERWVGVVVVDCRKLEKASRTSDTRGFETGRKFVVCGRSVNEREAHCGLNYRVLLASQASR